MAVPPIPPPIAQLGNQPFSFYPAILNAAHNEWVYRSATWSEVLVRNTKTSVEMSVPRRYIGEISSVDGPVVIVGLLAELEYREGVVWPAEHRVIEMPHAVNEAPRPRLRQSSGSPAPVVSIRLEGEHNSKAAKVAIGGVALGLAGCVLAISLFRGGVLANHAFYAPAVQIDLPLTASDNRATVVRELGEPAGERWHSESGRTYEVLVYPQRRLYAILMGPNREDLHYAGAMNWHWRPAHTVDVPGFGSTYPLLRRLPKF